MKQVCFREPSSTYMIYGWILCNHVVFIVPIIEPYLSIIWVTFLWIYVTLSLIDVMFFISASCHYLSSVIHIMKQNLFASHHLKWITYMDGFLIILFSLFPSLKSYLNYLGHFFGEYVFIHLLFNSTTNYHIYLTKLFHLKYIRL